MQSTLKADWRSIALPWEMCQPAGRSGASRQIRSSSSKCLFSLKDIPFPALWVPCLPQGGVRSFQNSWAPLSTQGRKKFPLQTQRYSEERWVEKSHWIRLAPYWPHWPVCSSLNWIRVQEDSETPPPDSFLNTPGSSRYIIAHLRCCKEWYQPGWQRNVSHCRQSHQGKAERSWIISSLRHP